MVTSYLGLTDNLAEGLHKCKSKDCKSWRDYITASVGLLTSKCINCGRT